MKSFEDFYLHLSEVYDLIWKACNGSWSEVRALHPSCWSQSQPLRMDKQSEGLRFGSTSSGYPVPSLLKQDQLQPAAQDCV